MPLWLLFSQAVWFMVLGYFIGHSIGKEQGHRSGYLRGRAVSRAEFWRE
jgi:hypothetical protein